MFRLKQNSDYNFRVWHMLLAVIAMAFMMGVALKPFELPKHDISPTTWYGPYSAGHMESRLAFNHEDTFELERPPIEVLPFNMQGEVPGPLLTSILRRYMPDTTSMHADELRGTLPPGENPRMIVILPEDEAPEFY